MQAQEPIEVLWKVDLEETDKKKPKHQRKVVMSALDNLTDIVWDKLNGKLGECWNPLVLRLAQDIPPWKRGQNFELL